MIRTTQNSLRAMLNQAQQASEIGLRATAALGKLGCDACERWNALHVSALRSAMDNGAALMTRMSASEPSGAVEPTIDAVRRAIDYWRSMTGLCMTSQAEWAETMDSVLAEVIEVTDASRVDEAVSWQANVPLAGCFAAGISAMTTAQAMCGRWAQAARQFGADSGVDRAWAAAVAVTTHEPGETRAHTHRKAA